MVFSARPVPPRAAKADAIDMLALDGLLHAMILQQNHDLHDARAVVLEKCLLQLAVCAHVPGVLLGVRQVQAIGDHGRAA